MDIEAIKIYSFQDFKHKEYIKKMDIKKLALIHLLLDDGSKSEQIILNEISDFNPNLVNYSSVNINSLNSKNHYCKYMDYFSFAEGFFYGKEYNDDIKVQRLYLTQLYPEKFYFWREIDFETYKDTLFKNADTENQELKNNILEQINRIYKEWLLGNKILLKHLEANFVNDFDIDYFEKNINTIEPTNNKIKIKNYTGVILDDIK